MDVPTFGPVQQDAYGVPLDSFAGNDDQKFSAAISYAAAQSYPPAIVLPTRTAALNNGPYSYFNGLRLVGSLGTGEREFSTTGPHSIISVGGSALFKAPQGTSKNMWFQGIQFRAQNGKVNWMTPVADLGGGPLISDTSWDRVAWTGFASVMQARHLRCTIDRMYCNGGTDTQFKLAGSDNYYFTAGQSYLSSTTMPANAFYLWFPYMSSTRVGPIYITPRVATGVRIDNSFGNLHFDGTLFDNTGGTTTTACQGAALLINGGPGMTFSRCWFYNNAVDPAATGRNDQGQVCINGGSDILFLAPQFNGGAKQGCVTPAGTPAIYAGAAVSNVQVVAPMAPSGGARLIHQRAAGVVTCSDPSWSVRTLSAT